MNYYKAYAQLPAKSKSKHYYLNYTVRHLQCCAATEATLSSQQENRGTRTYAKRVENSIITAIRERKTWVFFFIPVFPAAYDSNPTNQAYKQAIAELCKLPACTEIGCEINPNSGNKIRVFVVNLRKEWK